MNLWIVYDKVRFQKNEIFSKMLVNKASFYGFHAKVVFSEDLDLNSVLLPDVVIMRTVNVELSKFLEAKGVIVSNNSLVSEICNDKWKTYEYVKSLGIKILNSVLINREQVEYQDIEYPKVLKSRFGHGGNQVFLVNNKLELIKAFNLINEETCILQDVSEKIGKDVRTYLVGNDNIVSILRTSKTDFRSNFSLGGEASLYSLNEQETSIINTIKCNMNMDFVGIDLIFNKDEAIFNEIEDVVGCRMVYSITPIDIVNIYIKYLYNLYQKR